MSLILEALKKLERDKKVDDRGGFLVMAAQPWPSPGDDRRTLAWVAAGGVAMMAVGAGLALWFWRGGAPPSTAAAHAPAPPAAARVSQAAPLLPPPVVPVRPPASSRAAALPRAASAESPKAAGRDSTTPPSESGAKTAAIAPAVAAEPVKPAAPVPRFRLTAISQRDGKAVAVLNERMVYVGDSVDDATVVRIGDAEVELQVAGKPIIVPFAF